MNQIKKINACVQQETAAGKLYKIMLDQKNLKQMFEIQINNNCNSVMRNKNSITQWWHDKPTSRYIGFRFKSNLQKKGFVSDLPPLYYCNKRAINES